MSHAPSTPMPPAAREAAAARWMAAMRAGDWEAAWGETDRLEAARRARPGRARLAHELRWDGTPPDGRVVRVRCLHGLGDTLQFMRFVPQVAARARRLHFLVQPALLPLLQGLPGLGEVSDGWTDTPPPCEVEIEVMELAYVLRCTPRTLPPPWPALRERVAARPLAAAPGALMAGEGWKLGLLWRASDWDPARSIPAALLAPLLRRPGARWFSLQQDQGGGEGQAATALPGLVPLAAHTGAVEDAAAAMLRLDGVLAVDGMPAHLAASLGVPTWVMLRHQADWRWMDGRADSPWYPSVRLLRQPRPGAWAEVVDAVRRALEQARDHRPRVRAPGPGPACSAARP